MRYRVTCLTPTLVGDGQRLSPIDYMVWKDHVNVLDQNRIFRLLAKGPRLEGYLVQLKKADKLDFASWGGFAQNYAGRRIPFDHPSSTQFWERAQAENLFIPLFASSPRGQYLAATALKGALRTGFVHGAAGPTALDAMAARAAADGRLPRHPGEEVERATLGPAGADALKALSLGDSDALRDDGFRIYLLRVATLEARSAGKYELGWKQSPRGTVRRAEESTPVFAEMAAPGTAFEGDWRELELYRRRKGRLERGTLFGASNAYAEQLIRLHLQYAEWAGLTALGTNLRALETQVADLRSNGAGCVLPLGWGAGFLSKTAFLDTTGNANRQILRQVAFYGRAIQSGMPFPKTRRIVFPGNQPAAIPGFVRLEVLA